MMTLGLLHINKIESCWPCNQRGIVQDDWPSTQVKSRSDGMGPYETLELLLAGDFAIIIRERRSPQRGSHWH